MLSLYQDTEYYKVKICKDREEWLKARSKTIGGSDASALVDLNPWKDNNTLWKELKGKVEIKDISDKPQVKYGIEAEDPLRRLFELDYPQYEVQYMDNTLMFSKSNDFMHYSADGLLIEKDTGKKGILEIKTTNILQTMQYEKWNEQIPNNYYIQCLHGLLVTGFDFVILKAQLKSEWKTEKGTTETRITIKHYPIYREEVQEDLEWLLQKEIEVWKKYYITDIEPSINLDNLI